MNLEQALDQFIEEERQRPRQLGLKGPTELYQYDSQLYADETIYNWNFVDPRFPSLSHVSSYMLPLFTGEKVGTLPWPSQDAGHPLSVQAELFNRVDETYGTRYRRSVFHRHDYFEFIYVYRGSCENTMRGERVFMRAGEGCLLNKQEIHQIGIYEADSVVFNLLLHPDYFLGHLSRCAADGGPMARFVLESLYADQGAEGKSFPALFFPVRDNPLLTETLHLLLLEYFSLGGGDEEVTLLLGLLLKKLSRLDVPLKEEKTKPLLCPSDLLTYLHAHLQGASLSETARYFGYAPRSLQRFLQEIFSQSFSALLTDLRIKEACRLCRDTDLPIEEVAEKVGYGSRSYLDRMMKKATGKTALAYRAEAGGKH